MKFTVTLSLLLATCIFLGSCNKEPAGGVPFYVSMDTAVIVAPPGVTAGSNTQRIQDVWVQEGATNMGAYELPCRFPVLDSGSCYFVVNPGVWQSGQSTNPVIYPFMNPDTFTIHGEPGQLYKHVPKFAYKAAATVLFNEDFELSSDYNSNMVKCYDTVKYGLVCGKITVHPTDSSVTAVQKGIASSGGQPYTLTSGQEIWVEMDYKSDVPFWSGIIAHFSSGATDTIQILFLLPSKNWNKEYIKMSETVGQEGASTYNLYFQALNPSGTNGGSVYLDNIRLVKM